MCIRNSLTISYSCQIYNKMINSHNQTERKQQTRRLQLPEEAKIAKWMVNAKNNVIYQAKVTNRTSPPARNVSQTSYMLFTNIYLFAWLFLSIHIHQSSMILNQSIILVDIRYAHNYNLDEDGSFLAMPPGCNVISSGTAITEIHCSSLRLYSLEARVTSGRWLCHYPKRLFW